MSKPRVVVAGLGDSGLLSAVHLARARQVGEVVGISAKTALVSGQELGVRLARPDDWARDYFIGFDRFRGLDGVRTVHGNLLGLDPAARSVSVEDADGATHAEPYDVLVIATGVTNGFWRRPDVQSPAEVEAELRSAHERLGSAGTIAVVGGGAAAVSSALNVALAWPSASVHLYFPGERALPHHHGRVWRRVQHRLAEAGVALHAGHRAVVPEGFACDEITEGPLRWSTGQPPAEADAVLWAIGRVSPNSSWLPTGLLDADGFVRVDPQLRVPEVQGVWAVGDIAATDPLRTSARNRADKLLAHNIRATISDRELKDYEPPRRRWGSVLGVQPDGLEVFAANGRAFRFPAWTIDSVLQPWIVRRGIYGGVRRS
ncbi:FAD-dependent oxidoreductase [Nocardioides sp.]|uniref:FAD-dependent oxidoreductase n=1 Tax=Nocardioides sp. TaxID=35761 RepID=UPI00321A685E